MTGLVFAGPALDLLAADQAHERDLASRTTYGPGNSVTVKMRPEDFANPNPNAWAEFKEREARKAFWIIVKQGWL